MILFTCVFLFPVLVVLPLVTIFGDAPPRRTVARGRVLGPFGSQQVADKIARLLPHNDRMEPVLVRNGWYLRSAAEGR